MVVYIFIHSFIIAGSFFLILIILKVTWPLCSHCCNIACDVFVRPLWINVLLLLLIKISLTEVTRSKYSCPCLPLINLNYSCAICASFINLVENVQDCSKKVGLNECGLEHESLHHAFHFCITRSF